MLQYLFSLRQFRLINAALSYIVLRLTFIQDLILELGQDLPDAHNHRPRGRDTDTHTIVRTKLKKNNQLLLLHRDERYFKFRTCCDLACGKSNLMREHCENNVPSWKV